MKIDVETHSDTYVILRAREVRSRYVRRRPVVTFAWRLRRAKSSMQREAVRRERKLARTDAATERFKETLP